MCATCRNLGPTDATTTAHETEARRRDLEKALADCRGNGTYDALVCLSGGKDSLDLLYRAKAEGRNRVRA